MLDFKIFVDADPDIRERGSTYDNTIKRYLSTVKPMHDAFVEPSKSCADIIIPRGGQNEIATELLGNLVEHYILHK
ncbi:MAG: hypothetical protein AB9858_03295 [Acidaminococcaceae bacterium]